MAIHNNVKIKRTFMRDEAYDILRNWITVGKLEPGEILKDQVLSELLGISRTPIREALLRLELDGLVVTKANSSTSVTPVYFKEAENIYPIVETLECLAIEQVLQNITEEVIQEIEELNHRFINKLKEGDKVAAFQLDNHFHEKIVKMSNNTELTKILINLKIKVQRMEIHYLGQVDNGEKSIGEHEEIIKAIKKRDKERLIKAIQENWRNSLSRILESDVN